MAVFLKKIFGSLSIALVLSSAVLADETVIDGVRRAEIDQIRGVMSSRLRDNAISLDRSGSTFHRQGTRVFSRSVVGRFRGVVSQGNFVSFEDGVTSELTVRPLSNAEFDGAVLVRTSEGDFKYSISYDDLLPLVLLADSNATSLYSLTSDIRDQVANASINDWASEAGMVVMEDEDSVIALELYGTQFFRALRFADLCSLCEGAERPDVASKINRVTGATRSPNVVDRSWIITDVTLPYEASLTKGTIQVDGTLTRNHWTLGQGADVAFVEHVLEISPEAASTIYSRAAELFAFCDLMPSDDLCSEMLPELELAAMREANLLDMDIDQLVLEDGSLDLDSIAKRSQAELEIAEFAFETLALFRHAKNADPDLWSDFLESVSTDQHMSANLSAWQTYATALQEAYPN